MERPSFVLIFYLGSLDMGSISKKNFPVALWLGGCGINNTCNLNSKKSFRALKHSPGSSSNLRRVKLLMIPHYVGFEALQLSHFFIESFVRISSKFAIDD